ncbi:MAG: sigma-54 dependent transcriptional regulator, partial [Porticoccaceae bacterium]|nr:sigma-54 dependent transcriptional regulator [Porticoccaceae bacterium]
FLAVNCAALVDNLLESELFGHERGAFTGATNRKPGKFELAANGTLFLDEIGEMALPLQAKLLRVLQEGSFERVGGSQLLHSNARVIAATNRDLPEEITNGNFREDLYYRLNALEIQLPPLRERREDLPLLIEGLLQRVCRSEGKCPVSLDDGALAGLKHYDWPGNIRELENVLTQAVIRCRSNLIHESDLNLKSNSTTHHQSSAKGDHSAQPLTMAELEARHIQYVLDYCGGHKGKTCKVLEISRPALDRKIERYHLEVAKP